MDKKDQTLAKQILFGLGYTDQFLFPLTVDELWQRLPEVGDVQKYFSRAEYQRLLGLLKKRALVEASDSYVMISSKKSQLKELVKNRKNRAEYAVTKLEQSRDLLRFLQKIPWISGVLVTGSVSMLNAKPDDDVDFLIITKPHTLWLTRPFVIAYSWLKGKRRSWKREEKNSWCFNFWLEETQLQMPVKQQTLYTAYELLQANWLLAEQQVQREYYHKNRWVQKKIPRLFAKVSTQPGVIVKSRTQAERAESVYLFFYFPLLLLNRAFYIFQRLYMRSHQTTERVGEAYAFFHPRDTRSLLYEGMRQSLLRLLKN